MFEKRLKQLAGLFVLVLAGVVARLANLQVIHGDENRERAQNALLRPARTLLPIRGRILDRFGTPLAADEPSWQISVDYAVLSGDAVEKERYSADMLHEMWRSLTAFSGEPLPMLQDRGRSIVDRIRLWRRKVSEYHGYDVTLREERMAHPIVSGLDDQQQIEARMRFDEFPFVKIEHGVHRTRTRHPAFAHLLGRTGAVRARDLKKDPFDEDPFRRYLPTDSIGLTGVEEMAEATLRGSRGVVQHDRRRKTTQHLEPQHGHDVALTIRCDLQTEIYRLLEQRVPELLSIWTGASVVVLDVETREILGLVSYPGYDPTTFNRDYQKLRDDMRHTPLRFRCVANGYEPGSIVKPLTCLGGMVSGIVGVDTTLHCDGYFDRERFKNSFRCWQISGTTRRKAHGDVNVAQAITGSCNVFMYRIGDGLGVGGLTGNFDMAGLGLPTGIGLMEERRGINPTPTWLATKRNTSVTPGIAWNLAIGQGQVIVTPVQAANLMAVYASGKYRAVTLLAGNDGRRVWELPGTRAQWSTIRDGIFGVTNSRTGTAYKKAHWTNERYALCGKTGSATTRPAPISFEIKYKEQDDVARTAIVPGKVRKFAVERFLLKHPDAQFDPKDDVSVAKVWPEPTDDPNNRHAHAWFAGYLQRIRSDKTPIRSETPKIAFAVMVEFGGSGGRVAGPIARDIAQLIYDTLGPNLNPDEPPVEHDPCDPGVS